MYSGFSLLNGTLILFIFLEKNLIISMISGFGMKEWTVFSFNYFKNSSIFRFIESFISYFK